MKVINLLPDSEKQALEKVSLLQLLRRFMFLSFASYILVVLGLLGGRIYEERTLSTLDSQIAQQQKAIDPNQDKTLTKQINLDNGYLSDYLQLAKQVPSWSPVLAEFAGLVPGGIKIQSFSGSSASGKIDISGHADTRDEVLQLHDNIASSSTFKSIDMPLENLQKPSDLDFHFTMFLDNGALISK